MIEPRARVHMLVWNTFLNDARVYNEAVSLKNSGLSVTVHALAYAGMFGAVQNIGEGLVVSRHGKRLAPGRPTVRRGKLGIVYSGFHRLTVFASIAFDVLKAKPQVIHAHDVNMLPLGWLLAFLTRASLVYDAHEISTHREGYRSIRKIVALVESTLMPSAAGCITTTSVRSKFFSRAYKMPRPLILQNRPRFQCLTKSNRLRDQLGLTESWPIVLYQGGLQPGRGLNLLIQAASEIDFAYFVFLGGGGLSADLKKLATSCCPVGRIYFIDTVPLEDLPSYTASADIGVQPIENTCLNHYSTDSNKLFEYIHAGLAVVASNLPEIKQVVNANGVGLLVSPGSLSELIGAIKRLLDQPQERLRYRENAGKTAPNLCWEKQEHLLIALYEKVLEAG